MYVNKENSKSQAKNETHEVTTFNFSENKNEIRNVFVNNQPYFIGSDVAKALGYKNTRKALKDHCKGVTKCYALTNGGKQLMNVIPESDVYRLIIGSTLPKAQEFERWVMEDVLPTLHKKGYYGMRHQQKDDFIDARTIPCTTVVYNNRNVRVIEIENTKWFSINDYYASINCRTNSCTIAEKLNRVQQLAVKIWLFGVTKPAWFTNELGLQLIASSSKIVQTSNQLKLL